MNDLTAFKDIIISFGTNLQDNSKLAGALIVFIAINLVVTCINVWAQFSVKNKDKKILTFRIKEKRRIDICENIYHELTELSDVYGSQEEISNSIISKVNRIRANTTKNKLYISKELYNHINVILDYFIGIATDYSKKDIYKEIKLFQIYSNIFNK